MIDPSTRFVDIHYHAGVDLYQRRHTTRVAGQRYAEQQGWVVAKSHLGSTAAQAWEARQDGLPVSGSLTLNMISGGLDVRSIEQSTYQHGQDSPMRLVVYLPTLVDLHASTLQRTPFHSRMDAARLGRLRVHRCMNSFARPATFQWSSPPATPIALKPSSWWTQRWRLDWTGCCLPIPPTRCAV